MSWMLLVLLLRDMVSFLTLLYILITGFVIQLWWNDILTTSFNSVMLLLSHFSCLTPLSVILLTVHVVYSCTVTLLSKAHCCLF